MSVDILFLLVFYDVFGFDTQRHQHLFQLFGIIEEHDVERIILHRHEEVIGYRARVYRRADRIDIQLVIVEYQLFTYR